MNQLIKKTFRFNINSYICGLILLTCVIWSEYSILSYISAITFIYYIFDTIIVKRDRLFLKYINIVMFPVTFLIGTFICDNFSLWLGEVKENTFYSGAFCALSLYYWIYLTFIKIFDSFSKEKYKKNVVIHLNNINIEKFAYKNGKIIIFLFGIALFLVVIRHPFFLSGLEHRFLYSQIYISRFLNIIRTFPILLSPLLTIPFLQKNNIEIKKIVNTFIFPYIPYMIFLFWTGNKFGEFWDLFCSIAIPILANMNLSKKTIRYFIKYAIIFFCFFSTILITYYMAKGNNIVSSFLLLGDRIAIQGELWWKVFAFKDDSFKFQQALMEVKYIWESIITDGISKKYGIYHLMDLLGNPAVVELYRAQNTRFSASGIELPFYFFGYFSFIIVPLITTPMVVGITNIYVKAIKNGYFFLAISSLKILYVLISSISQGDWYAFTSTSTVFFIIIFIFSIIIYKRGN